MLIDSCSSVWQMQIGSSGIIEGAVWGQVSLRVIPRTSGGERPSVWVPHATRGMWHVAGSRAWPAGWQALNASSGTNWNESQTLQCSWCPINPLRLLRGTGHFRFRWPRQNAFRVNIWPAIWYNQGCWSRRNENKPNWTDGRSPSAESLMYNRSQPMRWAQGKFGGKIQHNPVAVCFWGLFWPWARRPNYMAL